jgi:hypothetical protein
VTAAGHGRAGPAPLAADRRGPVVAAPSPRITGRTATPAPDAPRRRVSPGGLRRRLRTPPVAAYHREDCDAGFRRRVSPGSGFRRSLGPAPSTTAADLRGDGPSRSLRGDIRRDTGGLGATPGPSTRPSVARRARDGAAGQARALRTSRDPEEPHRRVGVDVIAALSSARPLRTWRHAGPACEPGQRGLSTIGAIRACVMATLSTVRPHRGARTHRPGRGARRVARPPGPRRRTGRTATARRPDRNGPPGRPTGRPGTRARPPDQPASRGITPRARSLDRARSRPRRSW